MAWTTAGASRHLRAGAPAAGLANDTGDNHCYLNAAVQALLRVGAARAAVDRLGKLRSRWQSAKHPLGTLVDETASVFRHLGNSRTGASNADLGAFRRALREAVLDSAKTDAADAVGLGERQLGDAGEALELIVTTLFRAERWMNRGARSGPVRDLLPSSEAEAGGAVADALTCVVRRRTRCTLCGHTEDARAVSSQVTEPVIVADLLAQAGSGGASGARRAAGTAGAAAAAGTGTAGAAAAAGAGTAGAAAAPPSTPPRPVWGGAVPATLRAAAASSPAAVCPPEWAPGSSGRLLATLSRSTDPLVRCSGCNKVGGIRSTRRLVRGGESLSLQLVWPPGPHASGALSCVRGALGDLFVDLADVFDGGAGTDGERLPCRLRACVLFRAAHFVVVADVSRGGGASDRDVARLRATGAGSCPPPPAEPAADPSPRWVCIDDSAVRPAVSPWDHCERLGFAPCLLVFETLGPGAETPSDGGRALAEAA